MNNCRRILMTTTVSTSQPHTNTLVNICQDGFVLKIWMNFGTMAVWMSPSTYKSVKSRQLGCSLVSVWLLMAGQSAHLINMIWWEKIMYHIRGLSLTDAITVSMEIWFADNYISTLPSIRAIVSWLAINSYAQMILMVSTGQVVMSCIIMMSVVTILLIYFKERKLS